MNFLKKYAWGILLCLVIAVPAWLLGKRFEVVGGPVFAILIGMVIALFWKEQGGAKPGITYTSKKILQLAVVLLGFGMNIALTLLFSLLSEAFSIPITGDGYYLTSYPLTNVLMIVTVVIAAPLFEEYLFRGVILMTLQRYGNWFAIMVSSLLFALSHGTISQAACVFFLGFVIGYLTVRSGSLRLAILFHMLNNAIALLPMFISSEMFSNLLSLVLLAAGIAGVVLLILLIRRRKTFVASLTTPYDYPISRFFQNWASILLIILFVAMLLINFVQIL